MAQAPALSPDLARQSAALARALAAAARTWGLYPPEHPAVAGSVRRLGVSIREATAGTAFSFGVTPTTLMVAGVALAPDQAIAEAARLCHDRDILQLSFLAEVPASTLHSLLALLASKPEELRAAGGPSAAWAAAGHASVAIEQIDYEKILEDRGAELPPADRRDDIWRSLVNSIARGDKEFDEAQQRRLLDISTSAADIRDLTADVIEPKRSVDGSPLITTQAATVLAVFRHLAGIVTVMAPERVPEIIRNVATATTALDPHVVLQMMQLEDGARDTPIVARLAAAFDDRKVAGLLAAALARDGRATTRLAQVFATIAPDEQRKRRVLTMTRSMLSEQDFGKSGQFRAVWSSMETLLLSYDESPYVSAAYQASLEGAPGRGDMLARCDLPAELPQWLETLEQDSVRLLSVLLITDLLRIETNADRAADIAHDMLALLDDLFLAGDFGNALLVLRELRQSAAGSRAAAAARSALTTAGESAAVREAASLLGDLDNRALSSFAECCALIGPAAARALLPAFERETPDPAYERARDIVQRFGAEAVPHVAALVEDRRWFVQRNAATLLGATRSADAVPPLQTLLRRNDPRVLRAGVSALAGIDDPSAARALQTVLRAAAGDGRAAVVQALVAGRDPRVVPMLGRILAESNPFGDDHQVVVDALDAIGELADDRAVPGVVTVMRRKKLFGGRKVRAIKTASVRALSAIGTSAARAALDAAARDGDRLLKKAVREVAR